MSYPFPRMLVTALALLLSSAVAGQTAATGAPSPADLYGPLFARVQTERLFADGKTFADAAPRRDPAAIKAAYLVRPPRDPASLRAFVLANFSVPGVNDREPGSLRAHVRALWPMLVRQPVAEPPGGSALPLPAPFVVPGGRFREIYYWDSYFTMLGLRADGRPELIESMLADFTDAIERWGHIPNGFRTYYLSRSQPPFFALMLDLSANTDPALAKRRLAALRREHDFWMRGTSCLDASGTCARVVRMPDGALLNRYWDDRDTPRDESYAEDVATAARSGRPAKEVQRALRAAAESGWDFSARWLGDPQDLGTIRTPQIVPVDLNSLMVAMEERIARRCREIGDARCEGEFTRMAAKRKAAIDRYLWVPDEGRYADWDRGTRRPTAIVSAASLFPLFVGIATPAQAKAMTTVARRVLLAPGGVRTTPKRTGQQWDAPNGWAPLQWIAIQGFARYGEDALARDIAARWMRTVAVTYGETGRMLEKYDIEERKPGGGGEYPTQDGFGWTNGVSSALLERYPGLLAK